MARLRRPTTSTRAPRLFGLLLLALSLSCRAEGTRAARVSSASDGPPAWELVYERDVGGAMDLFVVPAAGGPERRLTDHPAFDCLARWTPDARNVVFTSYRTGRPQLWEIGADGRDLRRLRANDARESQADVSPDGRRLAFLSDLGGPQRLLVEDLETGGVRVLVRHGGRTVLGNPDWSPDGRLIVFSSNRRFGHEIYVVDAATGEERRISETGHGGCEPRFSSDGSRIVYVSRGHSRPTSRLVAHDLATGVEATLVGWPALNYDPVYSPDDSELAFASNITGRYAIYRQRLADGRAWRVSFAPGDARYPDYRPVPSR